MFKFVQNCIVFYVPVEYLSAQDYQQYNNSWNNDNNVKQIAHNLIIDIAAPIAIVWSVLELVKASSHSIILYKNSSHIN